MFGTTKKDITIPKFYENKSVFVTGATGFIGRLLVEKLLRSCPGINKIYVLLRPKKGKSAHERIKDIIDIPIFDQIRNDNIKLLDKIVAVAGNTDELDCGLSDEDKKTIIENVSIIFHNAASVRFDDCLKKAVFSNTRSARDIALLARQLKKVDVLVHTSTAFSNSDHSVVEEKLYPQKMKWQELIRIAEEGDDRVIEIVTQKLIFPMPNTYTFTKALGEHAVVELTKGKIPCVISRPTIVLPTYAEPVPGWVDNLNGPVAIIYGLARGVLRIVYGYLGFNMDHVFADSVIKAMIIASWKKALSSDVEEVSIYNISSDLNCSSFDLVDICDPVARKKPFKSYVWPYNLTIYTNYYIYYFMVLLTQVLPAILIDIGCRIVKRKPFLLSVQRKIFIAYSCLIYFNQSFWNFVNDNYRDLRQSILPEDVEAFSIVHFGPNPSKKEKKMYFGDQFCVGIRKYIAKEEEPNEEDFRKRDLLRLIEKVWKLMWLCLFVYFIILKNDRIVKVANRISNYLCNLDV